MSHDHIADQEDAGTRACQAAAQAAGKTAEQADNCDDGEHSCPTCPWRKVTSNGPGGQGLHPARIAAKWWLQARNRHNLGGEAIAIRIGHEIDRAEFLAGVENEALAQCVAEHMRKIDQRTADLAMAEPTDDALLRQALDALLRYSRWAADMGTEMDASNAIRNIKTRLGVR